MTDPPKSSSHPEPRGRPRASLLANASSKLIPLGQIRSEHPLFQQALQRLHPRLIDDVLTLTPVAIQTLCALHPLVVRPLGRGRSKGYEVLAGMLAWRALRPHHALWLAEQASSAAKQSPEPTLATPRESAHPSNHSSRRKRLSLSTLPVGFQLPAVVLPGGTADADIQALLLAEQWLLLTSVGPLKALGTELAQLHRQASQHGWIDDLTPRLKSLSALARALDVTRQTLNTRRRAVTSSDHEPPSESPDRA